jgi:hypothetical protein
MQRLLSVLGILALLVCLSPNARADWSDDFEAYAVGSGLHGQGGWAGWEGDPTWDAYVTQAQAHSPTKSVEIISTSDMVQEFSGYTSGVWEFTAWQYIPGNHTGDTYFIMLNTYGVGIHNWSLQLQFSGGLVRSQNENMSLGWITDQWVEIKVVIDLDIDWQWVYYGGGLLTQKSWTDGVSGGGAVNIGAVDLFSDGADTVYYDDCSLMPEGATPVEATSWGQIKNAFK